MSTTTAIPAITRLDDLDRVVRVLHERPDPQVETARVAIGQAVEELALRGEARRNRDWRNPVAYRDTTVDCLRELIKWNLVEPAQLADNADAFLKIRRQPLRLTDEGRRFAALPAPERREATGNYLLKYHSVFREFVALLQRCDMVIPELTDAEVKRAIQHLDRAVNDQDGWARIAAKCERPVAEDVFVRQAPGPTRDDVTDAVGRYLRKRFASRQPKNVKELTGATNKAVAQAFLSAASFRGDWNAYDRCLRWARDLFIGNDGRHVHGIAGWVAWSTATVEELDGRWTFSRRGYAQWGTQAAAALLSACEQLRGSGRAPLLPIYVVRETAAFSTRLSDAVVDRALGELAKQRSANSAVEVRLHLADLKEFVPSARPFRLDGKKYFYVSVLAKNQ